MHTPQTPAPQPPATCPMHRAAAPRALVAQHDELVLPLHRRVVTQYAAAEAGSTELRLFCGDKEISFDEPAFFAFGETLAQQTRFAAGSATGWGAGYGWQDVQPLLEQLLEQGILRHADATSADDLQVAPGARPAPLPPGPCTAPRAWTEGPALMQDLTGRPLELGWLELVLPIFRVAHIALDRDGRQVGEANVFPKALRLDVPTNWRACIYPGTRYQGSRPMNVTALKAMRQHWATMMAALAAVRAAYLDRLPAVRTTGWTLGHLERLAVAVLAVPTYQLMRQDRPVANGDLHPALSSLFRVTDGLRMTLHQMLFVPVGEPALKADAPMTSAQILAYAERNYSFHSEHGVCAGPQAMIEEFLAVLVDGRPVDDADAALSDPAIRRALDDLDPALDYAFHGLRAHAAVFTLWPLMARSCERLLAIAESGAGDGQPLLQSWRDRLAASVNTLRSSSYLASEAWRAERAAVYDDMFGQCGRGLGLPAEAPLSEQIEPMFSCGHAVADAQLEALLRRRLGRRDVRSLCDALMDFLLQVQATLRVAVRSQAAINRLLQRAEPQRAFSAADVDIHNLLQGSGPRKLPYLIDELEAVLGLRITLDAERLAIGESESEGPARLAPHPPSPGMLPNDDRAICTPNH